jgi:hypothetical protein
MSKDDKQKICGHHLLSYLLIWEPNFIKGRETDDEIDDDFVDEDFEYSKNPIDLLV